VKDDRLYLIHIMKCIQRIEKYTEDGKEDFMDSSLKQDAIIRNFEIIGEAAKRLSPNLKDSCPGIPWRRISGFAICLSITTWAWI
jgi:uncharacterized protein with HEPN domain